MTLRYQRLRAPSKHGQRLQVPPLAEFADTLLANQRILAAHRFDLAGLSIQSIRNQARAELFQQAIDYTSQYRDVETLSDQTQVQSGFILSGHQPTLFHPGVWYKNFVLHHLAKQHEMIGINLVIDNDLDTLRSIRVPVGDLSSPRIELLKYDSKASGLPFENESLYDHDVFASFGTRVADSIRPLIAEPLVEKLWPQVMEALPVMRSPSMAIAAGRHRLESSFGWRTLELPLSQVCQSQAFGSFASELFARADEFRSIYNETLSQYRTLHRIKGTAHPVPDLKQVDEWCEMPFWIWSSSNPNRRPLFVSKTQKELRISDLQDTVLPLNAVDIESLVSVLKERGISIRPRALLTTMFSRLVLSDAFLHGIGGSKYDQVTDQVIHRFFGCQPPTYNTVTATYRLPIDYQYTSEEEVAGLEHELRRLDYHPEKFGDETNSMFVELAAAKKAHWQSIPTEGSKKAWHNEMDSLNKRLRVEVAERRQSMLDERDRKRVSLLASRKLGSREFSFCLFNEKLIDQMQL